MNKINVYTDGACKKNPGVGGWGWVEYHQDGIKVYDYGGSENTTNNRMELQAIISHLMAAEKGRSYRIHSDSMYCLKGLVDSGNGNLLNAGEYSGWMKGWKNKRFSGVKNSDLWKYLDTQIVEHLIKGTKLEFKHVKGHSGNPGNEDADKLANFGVDVITKLKDNYL